MERRIELTRDEQNMFLRAEDITVSRLASVFKVKPHTLYLEEMYTKNAEFPDEGRFKLKDDVLYTHYIVCGDSETCESASSVTELSSSQPGSSNPPFSGWSTPQPWVPLNNQISLKGNPLSRSKKIPMYNAYNAAMLKHTFPYVSLCLDHTGKNITVESTIDSIYVKIPESSVCASSILEEVAIRVGSIAEDLVILDAKFLQVSDDERDLDYWKAPSRRFYIANLADLKEVQKMVGKKLKRKHTLTAEKKGFKSTYEEISRSIEMVLSEVSHIKKEITIIKENEITHVEGAKKRAKVDVAREQLQLLECKICKDTPSPPVVLVTCCKQILGCEACFHSHNEKQKCCPLCHDSNYSAIAIRGLDEPYTLLQEALQS